LFDPAWEAVGAEAGVASSFEAGAAGEAQPQHAAKRAIDERIELTSLIGDDRVG
jgi:hypothetical protein